MDIFCPQIVYNKNILEFINKENESYLCDVFSKLFNVGRVLITPLSLIPTYTGCSVGREGNNLIIAWAKKQPMI